MSVQAKQHLVRAGSNWEMLEKKLRPGDEIILMPGVHRAATLDNLRGTEARPIVIRSVDPRLGAKIRAEGYGLRLVNPRHVRVENLIIDGGWTAW